MKVLTIGLVALAISACSVDESNVASTEVVGNDAPLTFELPADEILAAATQLVPRNEIEYHVDGLIECESISQEFPPYETDEKCFITIGDLNHYVEDPSKVIQAFREQVAQTGPYYKVSGTFAAGARTINPKKVETYAWAEINLTPDRYYDVTCFYTDSPAFVIKIYDSPERIPGPLGQTNIHFELLISGMQRVLEGAATIPTNGRNMLLTKHYRISPDNLFGQDRNFILHSAGVKKGVKLTCDKDL